MTTEAYQAVPRPVSTEPERLALTAALGYVERNTPQLVREEIRTLVSERDALAVRVQELEAENDQMVKALADCRNAFPIPEPGGQAEDEWTQAMACPLSVPTFVRAALTTPESKP